MLILKSSGNTTAFRTFSHSCRRLRGPHSTSNANSDARETHTNVVNAHAPSNPGNVSEAKTPCSASPPAVEQSEQRVYTNSLPPMDVDGLRGHLRDWSVLAGSSLRQHADQFSKKAAATFSQLGLHINRVTGYEEIEALKKQVVGQEARIKATRQAAREAKTAYDESVLQRSISQRQVNDLLQRKSSWTDADVSNFTSLVRSDHSFEQEETRAKARVAEMEDAVDREFSELMRAILARYHEEQVWSDKIRSASTYGSLAVLGVNLAVFIMAIIVVEPWKRKRLAQTFERKVEEMGAETKALVGAGATRLEERLAEHEKLLSALITEITVSPWSSEPTVTPPTDALPEATPLVIPRLRVYFSAPYLGSIGGRELVLVAGSAVAGGAITLLAKTLFGP